MGRRCAVRVLEGCRCGGVASLPQRPCENVAFPIGFWLPPLQTSPWRGGVPPPCFDSQGRCPNYGRWQPELGSAEAWHDFLFAGREKNHAMPSREVPQSTGPGRGKGFLIGQCPGRGPPAKKN